MNNGLISKLITSTSGILNTVNQIIPLYGEIKPLFKNIMSIKNKIKSIDLNKFFIHNNSLNKITNIKKEEKFKFSSSNPQFFL